MIAKRSGRLMDGFYTRCRKGPRSNCCNIPISLTIGPTGYRGPTSQLVKSPDFVSYPPAPHHFVGF